MSESSPFDLSGPLARQVIRRSEPIVEGRRYRVWLRIAAMSQGSVCVWVGGRRTSFFASAGDHVEEVVGGERPDVVVQGLDAIARIDGVAVTDARAAE